MEAFLETFMYEDGVFLADEVLELNAEERTVVARLATTRPFPWVRHQRVWPGHPAHLSVGELIMATAHLGALHGWFFHGLRWNRGWVGYGNRIHRADFKALALVGAPLMLRSRETDSRVGSRRIVVRLTFEFTQEEALVYRGDQTAMFLRVPDPTRPREPLQPQDQERTP